jgi:hypothetical protein
MMKSTLSRRNLVKGIASSVLAPALLPIAAAAQAGEKPYWMGNGMPQEGPDTPKIATGINLGFLQVAPRPGEEGAGPNGLRNPTPGSASDNSGPGGQGVTDEAIRGVVQMGVYHVIGGGPSASPWEADVLQPAVDKLKAAGVTLGNLGINVTPNIIYARKGRDQEIERIKQSTSGGK